MMDDAGCRKEYFDKDRSDEGQKECIVIAMFDVDVLGHARHTD